MWVLLKRFVWDIFIEKIKRKLIAAKTGEKSQFYRMKLQQNFSEWIYWNLNYSNYHQFWLICYLLDHNYST